MDIFMRRHGTHKALCFSLISFANCTSPEENLFASKVEVMKTPSLSPSPHSPQNYVIFIGMDTLKQKDWEERALLSLSCSFSLPQKYDLRRTEARKVFATYFLSAFKAFNDTQRV